jgi:hypothetical protein
MNAKQTRYLLQVALLLVIYPIAYGSPESGKASVVTAKEKETREKSRGTTIIKSPEALHAFLKSKPKKDELIRRLGTPTSTSQNPESVTFEVRNLKSKGEAPMMITISCYISDGRLTHYVRTDWDEGSRK